MKNRILLICLFCLNLSFAQEMQFEWAKAFEGSSSGRNTLSTDHWGNIYVAGNYYGESDFDPSVEEFLMTPISGTDIYISKFDPDGNFIWAKSIGGKENDQYNYCTVDFFGNVYLTGFYQDSIDFDPGIGTDINAPKGIRDLYLLKLNTHGEFLWVRTVEAESTVKADAITIDKDGDIFIGGSFGSTVDFDPGSGIHEETADTNGVFYKTDAFILKLTSKGNFNWVKVISGSGFQTCETIVTDAGGNVFVSGRFNEEVAFNAADTGSIKVRYYWDIYLAKITDNGEFVWGETFQTSSHSEVHAICSDQLGNVYLAGNLWGKRDMDPGPGVSEIEANGLENMFVLKMDDCGRFEWAHGVEGRRYVSCNSLQTDELGNLYISGVYNAGEFADNTDFDPSTGEFWLEGTEGGYSNIYLVKWTTNGKFISGTAVQGFEGSIYGHKMELDHYGNSFLTGDYYKTVDFDMSVGETELNSFSDGKVYLLKMSQDTIVRPTLPVYVITDASVYPNPSNGTFKIDVGGLEHASIIIYAVNGDVIYQEDNLTCFENSLIHINIDVASGTYILELKGYGQKKRFKLIVRKE